MQEVVCKVFFDDIALVAAANDEVIDAMMGVNLHDVPQDGLAPDLDHGLGLDVGFFAYARTQTAG